MSVQSHCRPLQHCVGVGVSLRGGGTKLQAPNVTVRTWFNKGIEHKWMPCRHTWNTLVPISNILVPLQNRLELCYTGHVMYSTEFLEEMTDLKFDMA